MNSVQIPLSPSVLVVHGDSFIALNIVRSIGRKGVPVTVLYEGPGLAAKSRYCSHAEKYSPGGDVVQRVMSAVHQRKLTHVIATSDDIISKLNSCRAEIEQSCTLLFPEEAAFNRALHKDETLTIAESIGVPCPRTVKVRSRSDLQGCKLLHFPVAVKPRRGIASFKVEYFDSLTDLAAFLEPALGSESFLVQEYVEGEGVGIEVLMRGGEPLLVFSHRRIREFPPTGGVSTCCEGIDPDPVLLDYSVRLLRAMEWDGVAMVEFKVNSLTKRAALMEVNGRFWGSLPLAIHSGANFPYELLFTSTSDQLSSTMPPMSGVRCRLLVAETKWLASMLRSGRKSRIAAVRDYLLEFSPACRYYCFSGDDPIPAVNAMVRRFQRLLPLKRDKRRGREASGTVTGKLSHRY
jgi:predicted ATP-grasp superfamily ATP-dependent carboligase